jgi:hypothetical protein
MAKTKATISLTESREQDAKFVFKYLEILPAGNKVIHYVDTNYNIHAVDITKTIDEKTVLTGKVGRNASYNLVYNPELTTVADKKIKAVCMWLQDHPDINTKNYEKKHDGIGVTNVKFNYQYMEVYHQNYISVFTQFCEAMDLYRTMNRYDEKVAVLLFFGINPIGMTHSEMHYMLSNIESGILWKGINTGLFLSNFRNGTQPAAVTKININKAINLGIITYKQGIGYMYGGEYIGSGIDEIATTYSRNPEKQIAIETQVAAMSLNIYDDIPTDEMPKPKVTKKSKEVVEA